MDGQMAVPRLNLTGVRYYLRRIFISISYALATHLIILGDILQAWKA